MTGVLWLTIVRNVGFNLTIVRSCGVDVARLMSRDGSKKMSVGESAWNVINPAGTALNLAEGRPAKSGRVHLFNYCPGSFGTMSRVLGCSLRCDGFTRNTYVRDHLEP